MALELIACYQNYLKILSTLDNAISQLMVRKCPIYLPGGRIHSGRRTDGGGVRRSGIIPRVPTGGGGKVRGGG